MSSRPLRAGAALLALLCLPLLAGSANAAAPKLNASFGVAGNLVKVRGSVGRGAPKKALPRSRWRAVLEEKAGRRWQRRASAKLRTRKGGNSRYALSWRSSSTRAKARLRVRIAAAKRTIAKSPVRVLAFKGRVPQPKVVRIAAKKVLRLPSRAKRSLVISGAHKLKPGEFLNAAPSEKVPAGFLLKVVSSKVAKAKTTVQVMPASLYEAVPNGSYALSLGNLASAQPNNAAAARLSRALASASAADEQASVPFLKKVECEGSGEMTLNGGLAVSLSPNLELAWGTIFGHPVRIERAKATVNASLSADAAAKLSAAAKCSLPEITLLEPSWTVVVPIGPVLLPVKIDVPITLNASAQAEGSVSISAHAGVQGTVGLAYDDGDVSPVHEISSDAALQHEVDAKASAQALLGPDITAKAGWEVPVLGGLAATVGVNAASGLRLSYDVGQAPPGKLCAPLKISGSLGFQIPVLGDIEGEKTIVDTDIKCLALGGTDLYWKGTITGEDFLGFLPRDSFVTLLTWHIDSTSPEGAGEAYLGYSGSYSSHFEEQASCGGPPQIIREMDGLGAGSASAGSGEGVWIDLEPGGFIYAVPPMTGTATEIARPCNGAQETTIRPEQTDVQAVNLSHRFALIPKPSGTRIQGSYETESEDSVAHSKASWDIEVTCPDGTAPDADWECP